MNDRPSQRYWKSNIALIRNLLSIWALVSIGASILFVEPLNTIEIGQIPLGFWIAQQGAIFTFVVLVFVYAVRMDKLEGRSRRNRDRDRS